MQHATEPYTNVVGQSERNNITEMRIDVVLDAKILKSPTYRSSPKLRGVHQAEIGKQLKAGFM